MVEQSKAPRTLTVEDFQKEAEIDRKGVDLKVIWKPKLSEPTLVIKIFKQLDGDWCTEFMAIQDPPSSDSFRETFNHPTLAEAFNAVVDVAVIVINERWKNEYHQGLVDAESKQEIDAFLKQLPPS